MKTTHERRAAFIKAFNAAKQQNATQKDVDHALELFGAEGPATWAENTESGDQVEAALRLAESENWAELMLPIRVAAEDVLQRYLTADKET